MSPTKLDYEFYSAEKYKREEGHIRLAESFVANLVREDIVLDIGCGDGFVLGILKKKHKQVEGIEISNTCVNLCKQRGLEIEKSTIEEYQPERKFDAVIVIDVLEHLEDYKKALKRIKSFLTEKGRIYVIHPNPFSLRYLFGLSSSAPRKDKFHTFVPSYFEMKRELSKLFNLERVEGIGKLKSFPMLSTGILFVGRMK